MTVGSPASHPADPDVGLFGPQTVTWRVHAEPVLWVGGIRALLLQALHPLAMAAVAEHSGFRADPWGRLMRTAEYVGTVTFGTTDQAAAAAARVRRVHRRVHGIDPHTATPYRADDPALLRWVHCCEVDSFLSVTRRAGLPLSDREADRYVDEQRRVGPLLGVPATELPAGVAELSGYFQAMRPQLSATPAARSAARFACLPPMPAWVALATPARPGWAAVVGLAAASLPRWARRLYRLPGLPVTDLGTTLALRALRQLVATLPAGLREGPHLRAARQRLTNPTNPG